MRTGGNVGGWDDYLKRLVRMGISFYVGEGKGSGPSRIGLSGGTEEGEPLLSKCMAPATVTSHPPPDPPVVVRAGEQAAEHAAPPPVVSRA